MKKSTLGQGFQVDDGILINNFFGNLTRVFVSEKNILEEEKKVAILIEQHVMAAEKEINYIYALMAEITEGQANFSRSLLDIL